MFTGHCFRVDPPFYKKHDGPSNRGPCSTISEGSLIWALRVFSRVRAYHRYVAIPLSPWLQVHLVASSELQGHHA